jgi:hypothetical protein
VASGWIGGSVVDFVGQSDLDIKLAVTTLTLYAVAQFKLGTPVLSGDLKRSFTADFENGGRTGHASSNLPYAKPIWVDGHSGKLPAAAVDGIIANMQKLPVRLKDE